MATASADTGRRIPLHRAAVSNHATTEDSSVGASASRTVDSHPSHCKTCISPSQSRAERPSSSYHLNSFWCLFNRYHVPRSLIQQGKRNRLVLFEEVGGDPTRVSFALRKAGSLCAHVSQSHPPPVDAVNTAQKKDAVLHLECPHSDHVISSVKFASFGTPHGTCGSYSHGNCSSTTALAILQQVRTSYSSTSLSLSEAKLVCLYSGRHASASGAAT